MLYTILTQGLKCAWASGLSMEKLRGQTIDSCSHHMHGIPELCTTSWREVFWNVECDEGDNAHLSQGIFPEVPCCFRTMGPGKNKVTEKNVHSCGHVEDKARQPGLPNSRGKTISVCLYVCVWGGWVGGWVEEVS